MNSKQNAVRHGWRLTIFICGSLIGFWVFLAIASQAGWIPSIWWGGESLIFPVYFGSTMAFVSALLCYVISLPIQRRFCLPDRFSYIRFAGIGVLQGFMLYPCVFASILLKFIIPGWGNLSNIAAVVASLLFAGVIDIIVSLLALVGIGRLRKARPRTDP